MNHTIELHVGDNKYFIDREVEALVNLTDGQLTTEDINSIGYAISEKGGEDAQNEIKLIGWE